MKIGFVFDDSLDKTDGVQQYIFSLASWLCQQGHEVHYLVGETKRRDIANVHSLARNIRVSFNGNSLSIPLWGSPRRIRALLEHEQFDVLHVQVPYHPLLAGRIIRAAGPETRVIGTFHIAPYSGFARLATRLLGIWSRPSLRRFDSMVSVSSAAQELARTAFKTETIVVPNVFDYHRFAQATATTSSAVPTITFLGRLVARKGCGLLLEAVALLKKRGVICRVVICGDGQLRPSLERFVHDNQLDTTVTFAGRIAEADKPVYLADSAISVFPSSGGESFGIVLLEAMASGKAAVIGGDNPGYRTVLGNRPELLCDAHDATALADTLQMLLGDERRRQELAAWGRRESQQYDVQVVGARLLKMYEGVA